MTDTSQKPPKQSYRLVILIVVIVLCIVTVAIAALLLLKPATDNNQSGAKVTPSTGSSALPTPTSKLSLDFSEDDYVYSGSAPIYVTIYSHNEDSWQSIVNTKAKYVKYRTGLLERINLLKEYGIDWNWQSDQPVVEAMIEYEEDASLLSTTNGKNILKYMYDLGISLDPHAHTNNYADIAYLMTQLGAEPSHVIGGTIVNECGGPLLGFIRLSDWHSNINLSADGLVHGEDYPSATWQPLILSDPGMGGHYFDDWSSGIWMPGNLSQFYTHNTNSQIVYVGEGYPHDATIIGPKHASTAVVHAEDGEYIKELAQKISSKELPTGTKDGKKFIYTASIHVRDIAIVTDGGGSTVTVDGLRAVLEELKPLRESNKIIFANFEDVVEIWKDEYNSVPWKIDLSTFSFYNDVKTQAEEYCSTRNGR